MTLAELRYLTALKQTQHFGRAAALCGVSQPALSNAIRKLEAELGVVLFERSRSCVRATPLGEDIIAQARKVLASATVIKEIAIAHCDHLTDPLKVGAIFTIAPYLLPRCVVELQKVGSPLLLHTEEGYSAALGEKLRQGELDALVVTLPFSAVDVVTQPLFEEPFAVIMPRHHPLASCLQLNENDLHQQQVLLPGDNHCLHQQILQAFPHLQQTAECQSHNSGGDTLEMLRSLVLNGLGVAILPLSAATALCAAQHALILRPFTDGASGRTVALAWRTSFPRHKAIDVLRQAILACKPTHDFYATDPEPQSGGLFVDNNFW